MLRAEGLRVEFRNGVLRKKILALDGLDIDVHEGDFFALVGQNGAGKSTAFYCFLGLLRPTAGRVTLFGGTPCPGSPVFARVGYLPEEPHYHGYLTVDEALTYYCRLYRTRLDTRRTDELLERFGLAPHRNLRIDRCSKGMKQKVGIVQCLLAEPRALFLDEPMRGLDPLGVRAFRDSLVELNRDGVTIVMNSHILAEVEMVATRVAFLDRGKVLRLDDLSSLTRESAPSYAVEFENRGGIPDYLVGATHAADTVKGTIPADRFFDFVDLMRSSGQRVVTCSLSRPTLEESYVALLSAGDRT
jgi:ABC-2 type transport system ATP-binding protein